MPRYNSAYSVRRSNRAKRMSLTVYRDGSVVITLPEGVSENIIEKVLDSCRKSVSKLQRDKARAAGQRIRPILGLIEV